MGSILPIRQGAIPSAPTSVKGKKSPDATTAAKVKKIELPIIPKAQGLNGRQVTVLDEATDLSNRIKTDWDNLTPEELAEKIIELEDKISHIKERSPDLDKVRKVAENLHFKFVFPVALEMDTTEKAVALNFAKTIYKAANQVFKTQSLGAFNALNHMQKKEVLRYAAGELS